MTEEPTPCPTCGAPCDYLSKRVEPEEHGHLWDVEGTYTYRPAELDVDDFIERLDDAAAYNISIGKAVLVTVLRRDLAFAFIRDHFKTGE